MLHGFDVQRHLQAPDLFPGAVLQEAPCHLDLSKLIQAGTKAFFNSPVLSDLTLVCPDGRALHCHSIILAAASRRFATALKQGACSISTFSCRQHGWYHCNPRLNVSSTHIPTQSCSWLGEMQSFLVQPWGVPLNSIGNRSPRPQYVACLPLIQSLLARDHRHFPSMLRQLDARPATARQGCRQRCSGGVGLRLLHC